MINYDVCILLISLPHFLTFIYFPYHSTPFLYGNHQSVLFVITNLFLLYLYIYFVFQILQ